jgi:predicted dehydrogenase
MAEKYGVPAVSDDYSEVLGRVDAAVLALPHHLHAPVAIDLLTNSIHVLVEKPMALKTSECEEMIKAAAKTGSVLAVGLLRRFYKPSQSVKQLLDCELLGEIRSFDFREGFVYSWNVASDFMFRRDTGGGVLADTGSHALDMLLWWLGDYSTVEYYDDEMGGVEADCLLHLGLESGATGVVELSRTRNLRNTNIIKGERGTLEIGTEFNALIRFKAKNDDLVLSGRVDSGKTADETIQDVFRRQLEDFVEAALGNRQPSVPGQEGKLAVKLIEDCYGSRQLLEQPWMPISEHVIRSV